MTGKTHVAVGTALMIALTVKYPNGIDVLGMTVSPAIGLITISPGSYGPDIDIQRSKLGQQHKMVSKHLKHRGITHTLLIPALLVSLMSLCAEIPVLPSLIFGFVTGWIIHIFADLFNRKGVPVFWPITDKKVHVACFKTGTWHEAVFLLLWLGGIGLCWITL